MTSRERTAYPRFKRHFTSKELIEIYTPTQAEIAFSYSTTRGQRNIFNLLLALKAFQRLGYFPKIVDLPKPVSNHIRSCLKFPDEIVIGYDNSKTMYRHRTAIREYLQVDRQPAEYRSLYNNLKQLPKRPTRNHLNDLIAHLVWLDSLGDIKPLLADITAAKIQHFAAEARVIDASEIKGFNLPKRLALILCLIYSAQVMTRDNLVEMFIKKTKSIQNNAKRELELIKQKQQETTEKIVDVFIDVLHIFIAKPPGNEIIQQVDLVFTPEGGAEQLLTECEAMNAYKGNNYRPLLWKFFKSHRSSFFRLISQLQFKSTTIAILFDFQDF